jgi:hypothetical protein
MQFGLIAGEIKAPIGRPLMNCASCEVRRQRSVELPPGGNRQRLQQRLRRLDAVAARRLRASCKPPASRSTAARPVASGTTPSNPRSPRSIASTKASINSGAPTPVMCSVMRRRAARFSYARIAATMALTRQAHCPGQACAAHLRSSPSRCHGPAPRSPPASGFARELFSEWP